MTNEQEFLAEQFEKNRGHRRGVAYRMLGSLSEADDAIQEAWLRLTRSDASEIDNLAGWLTTVVARICLDLLRARASRREDSIDAQPSEPARQRAGDPEQEALLADSVGLALMVVLDRLNPAERLAFVLHDLFALPFEEIGGILGRSSTAVRQLASRARRRVQGAPAADTTDLSHQRQLVGSFLAAIRAGDLEGLVAILDPDFAVHADAAASAAVPRDIHGAREWARQAFQLGRGARFARLALVDGEVGIVVAPRGRLFRVLRFNIAGGKISQMEIIGDPERLPQLDLAVVS